MATFPYVGFPDGVPYPVIGLGTSIVNVSTSAALTTALANAVAGQRIVLANATYSGTFTISGKAGTSSNPISIEASTTGGAVFASGSTLVVNNCAYVTVKGLSFPFELTAGGNVVGFRGSSHHCRITRCLLGPPSLGTAGTTKSTYVYGGDDVNHIRVDHNELRWKTQPGNAILFDGNFTTFQTNQHVRIDHNYIHDIKPEVSNEKEPIRLGVSTMSKTNAYSVIERNRFEACIAEPEVISVKACGVRVSGNTIYRCIGGPVYRHGLNGIMSDNYVVDRASTFGSTIGSGGFRFYDANHEISYNYVEGVYGGNFQGPLLLDSGDVEGSSTNLAGHWRVVNALVERNVIIGCPEGIRIGNNYSLAPTGCTIRDNQVAQATSGSVVTQLIAPANTTFAGNAYSSTPAGGGFTQDSVTIWRKAGYGPRITFLQSGDVGINGDASDADGTGALIATDGGAPPTNPGVEVGATTIFSDDFANLNKYPDKANPASYSMTIVSRTGHPTCVRFEVRDGDDWNGTERSEVTIPSSYDVVEGDERWYEFDICIGDPTWGGVIDEVLDGTVVMQLHPEDQNASPPLSLRVSTTNKLRFTSDVDNQAPLDFYTIRPGVWEHVVWHAKFSNSGSTGFVQAHINDVEVLPKTPRRTMSDASAYHKFGIYRDTDNTSTSVVLYDSLRISGPPATTSGGTPAAQSVTAVAVASGERFGLPTIVATAAPPDEPPPPDPVGSVPTRLGINTTFGTFRLRYSFPDDVPPPPEPAGPLTVSGAGTIPSAEAFGAPVLTVADGPRAVVGIGIPSAEAFGRPTVTAGAAPAPAPGGVLVPSLWAVGADGTTLTPLPAWTKITVAPVRNSPGALTVDYPAGAAGFNTLHDGVSAYPLHALEVRIWLGGNATGAVGGWLVQKSGDDLTPGSNWSFSGHFHEWLLSKALVGPQEKSTANPKGELRFAGATAGLILQTMMDQAQARGALPLVTRDFTSLNDSNGQPWAQQISSFNIAPKTTLDAVADKLVELGMVEYEFSAARMWRAYNPGTKGRDRTVDPTPLTFAQAINLSQHARQESARDAGTAVLAAGAEGFYAWADSPTAKAQLGWRAEVAADAGQVASDAGIAAVASTQLEAVRNGIAGYNGAIEMVPGSPLPLLDWGIGDWAYTLAGNTRRRLRVAQIGLTFAQGEPPRGTVVLNDLIADALTKLYRKINAISTGDAVIGTSTSTPGGDGEDINPPAAPIGVTVSSPTAYRVAAESTVVALVSVGWAQVTNNAYDGTETAGKAKAAEYITDRKRSGQAIAEDWTWIGMPSAVGTYGPALHADWVSAGSPTPDVTWLAAYPAAHLGGGAITDDVDHYRVQYSYIGGTVVGTTSGDPSGSPYSDLSDFTWIEPEGSPTTGLTLTFGDVTAERAIGVRVAAVDRSANQGPWSDVVGTVTAKDDTPPPAPSRPTVSAWFETMDITWDGNGSSGEDMRAAAPDLDGVEVHVSTGIAFLPDRPLGADGKIDYAASGTYKATLYTGGTWNVTDLTIGTTYFARLVAVDRAGNASPPSETSAGVLPQQLVQIDIGPNAIGRQQIIDLEVVTGKIANLAVNNAKISDLSVGKLTAGTMTAQVVIGGRFSTPIANNNQIQIDAAGIRLFQGSTVVGSWNVFDASMMVTGTYLSGLSGERINILPDGTFRMYGAAGIDFAQIANNGGIVQFRSRADAIGRRAYADFDPIGFTATYRDATGDHLSRFYTNLTYTVMEAPVTGCRVYDSVNPTDGTDNRFHFVFSTNNQVSGDLGNTVIHYLRTPETPSRAAFNSPANNSSVVFGASEIWITSNALTGFGAIGASAFNVNSARTVKSRIRDIDFGPDPAQPGRRRRAADVTQAARVQQWEYTDELNRPAKPGFKLARKQPDGSIEMVDQDWEEEQPPKPQHWGPMAEDLAAIDPALLFYRPSRPDEPAVNIANIAGIAWAAAAEAHDDIAELAERVAALERGHPANP